jgi:FAD/FMN-containing dehydrogenase
VVQNGLADRRPGLIVQCSGAADVIDAVDLAREQQLLTAVRAGGHSVAGYGVGDDGLMLDLSAMRGVWVDPDARVVRVQGGATWGMSIVRAKCSGWRFRVASSRPPGSPG